MQVLLIGLHSGTELKPHKANGAISIQVVEVTILFTAEDKDINMHKKQIIALTDNILHSVNAVEESFFC